MNAFLAIIVFNRTSFRVCSHDAHVHECVCFTGTAKRVSAGPIPDQSTGKKEIRKFDCADHIYNVVVMIVTFGPAEKRNRNRSR